MPQAKRAQFQVIGKYIDADGEARRPGDLIELEVGKDGRPTDTLAAARVRPFNGRVVGQSTDERAEATGIIDEARAKAAQIIDDAEAEASKIIDEASKQAESIVSEASKKPGK